MRKRTRKRNNCINIIKATSYLLIAIDHQGKRKKGKPSIIEFYQAMLTVCLEIAKHDIEQKETAERKKKGEWEYSIVVRRKQKKCNK